MTVPSPSVSVAIHPSANLLLANRQQITDCRVSERPGLANAEVHDDLAV
jgi:hypothetical protein